MSHLMGGVDAVLNTYCRQILVARDVDYRAFVKGQGRGVQILLPTRNMTSSYFQRIIQERKKQRKCLVV